MGILYLDRKQVALRLEGVRLRIDEPGERPRHLPLAVVDRVVALGEVTVDSRLLAALGERGVDLLCLGGRRHRRVALVTGPAHADARRRLAQYDLAGDAGLRLQWSKRLVHHKLRAQHMTLQRILQVRPDRRLALSRASARLQNAVDALAIVTDLDAARGVEGSSARAYFEALAAVFPPALGFQGRTRRPPRDPANAVLSLSYTLLHGESVTACRIVGLDPLIGFFHEPAYGRESLACDLMEPLRPRVDLWVWELFADRTLRLEHFRRDGAACLLAKQGRTGFFPAYELVARPMRRYLWRIGHLLAKRLLAAAPGLAETPP
jgi:CRISPR-associated protein Cas1